jgi:hypothetical protein
MIWFMFRLKPILAILPITEIRRDKLAGVSTISVISLPLLLFDGLYLCNPAKDDSSVSVLAFSGEHQFPRDFGLGFCAD